MSDSPEIHVTTKVDIALNPEHHHGAELVPMREVKATWSAPDDRRLEQTGWARNTYECPRCGDTVTIRVLAKSATVAGP